MRVAVRWMLFAGQPEVFQLPLWCPLGFVFPSHILYIARVCAFLDPLEKS